MRNELEQYIAEKLKRFDRYARPTKASGASTEIGDIYNKFFFIECKQRNTKNVTISKDVWDKLLANIPTHLAHRKMPLYALQNKYKDRFIVMSVDDFFNSFIPVEDYEKK